jgi:hypothetical protein
MRMGERKRARRRLRTASPALAASLLVLVPTVASAHLERTSYWPDPAPDTSVTPPAGGGIPKARSLASALDRSARGDTRVVCQNASLRSAFKAIRRARKKGVEIRPSEGRRKISALTELKYKRLNRAFFKRCRFKSIQTAVNHSGNNDRVVIMPGVYTEPRSRAQPTNDPRCDRYEEQSEQSAGALSYSYQVHCPNDQSLIFVQGRELGPGQDPPPQEDRFGIPNLGPCARCNLQIEGSAPGPDETIVDAGDPRAGNGGPSGAGSAKDVGIRADRADGFVLRNVTFRHAIEHTVYVHETDGYLLDRWQAYYAGEYGALMFTSDHGLTKNCDSVGNGDSAVYPGGAPDTGEQREEPVARLNQTITHCDIHHNTLGYSGTMGNGTQVTRNDFYDNSTAIATDSFYAGGHPGYPQDGASFNKNEIYSNNFNSYKPQSDVIPRVPVPVGTGILIAGGNNNDVSGNRIWDNWRRGTMLISVPDVVSGETSAFSTSHRNKYHDNAMGVGPNGQAMPNGVDFWWDDHPNQHDNCWFSNTGSDGTATSVTTEPPAPLIPSSCSNTSTGATYPTKAPALGGCAASIETDSYNAEACEWFTDPPRPGSGGGARTSSSRAMTARPSRFCQLLPGRTLTCTPFRGRP